MCEIEVIKLDLIVVLCLVWDCNYRIVTFWSLIKQGPVVRSMVRLIVG